MTVGVTNSASTIFAPTDGNGAARRPNLADAQRWGIEIERLVDATITSGPIFASTTAAAADLAWPANTMGWVYNPTTPAQNGVYRKVGASGSGSWVRVGDLPYNEANIAAAIEAAADAEAARVAAVAAQAAAEAAQAAAEAAAAAAEGLPDFAGKPLHGFITNSTATAVDVKPLAYIRGEHDRTPYDHGVSPLDPVTADVASAIQNLFNEVRADWSATNNMFKSRISLAGGTFTVGTTLNMTKLRQGGIEIVNGGLRGIMNDKPVLELCGTNSPMIRDLFIYGNETTGAIPSIGILNSKADLDGIAPFAFPDSKSPQYVNLRMNGFFSKANLVAFANEVSHLSNCTLQNLHPSLDAYNYVNVAHAGTLDEYLGGVTSDFVTIPANADGTQSNVIHTLHNVDLLRWSRLLMPITGINLTNPIQIVHSPATVAAAVAAGHLFVGRSVFYYNVGGTTQLNGNVYTVGSVDTTTGIITLSGVNGTSFSAWTSGGSTMGATGSNILLNTPGGFECTTGRYMLSLGAPHIVIDMERGGVARNISLKMHTEFLPPSILRIDTNATNANVEGLNIEIKGGGVTIRDAIIGKTGSGTVRIKNLSIDAGSSTAPASGWFNNDSLFLVENANLRANWYNSPSSAGEFSGSVRTSNAAVTPEETWGWQRDVSRRDFGSFSTTGATDGKRLLGSNAWILESSRTLTSSLPHQQFYNPNGLVGSISTSASVTAFNTTSDERLKDFLGALSYNAAKAIIQADPVRKFTWKVSGELAVGWGAQTSYAVSKDLATPPPDDDPDGIWSVDFSKRTPYLWAAVAGLIDEVAALRSQIEVLRSKND